MRIIRRRGSSRPVIALDADGVLLDYNRAYAGAWAQAFGERPRLVNPRAYWPMDRWGVERLEGERLARFRACFDATFWSTIPPLPGAVQASRDLAAAGYRLVCVTAMDRAFAPARWRNLRDLGFAVERVVAVGKPGGPGNPKAAPAAALRAVAVVDDYLPYLQGLPRAVHAALIEHESDRDRHGSPNADPALAAPHSRHADLRAFVDWWTSRPPVLP